MGIPVNQQIAMGLLQCLGYDADLAGSGLEAMAATQHQVYGIILMNMQMPQMDGLEATRRIRASNGPNQFTWIVALTAIAMPSDRHACRAAGMDDFLSKPFSPDALAACVQRGLMRQNASEDLPCPSEVG